MASVIDLSVPLTFLPVPADGALEMEKLSHSVGSLKGKMDNFCVCNLFKVILSSFLSKSMITRRLHLELILILP